MRLGTQLLVAASALAAIAGCGGKLGGHGLPSKPSMPTKPDVPGAGDVPGGLGGASGEVDPNTCGNYAATDAGAKLKAFLEATKNLETQTAETVKVVKQSCVMMGQELGMPDAELAGDDTKGICAKVITQYQDNLKIALKPHAKLKIKYTAAKCTIDAHAGASASGVCSGVAAAGTGGSGAAGGCQAAVAVNASLQAQCTPPELTIDVAAGLITNKDKAEMTLKAMRDGLPKLLSVSARLQPVKDAVVVWEKTANDLKDMGPKFAQSFKDQAMCITGQLAAAVNAATNIHANIEVSVSVSASASGSVGG